MQHRRLGSRGPEISVVGFGSWEAGGSAWGPNPPDEQTIAAMRAALDSGMTWIDSAEVYGRGRSEELVGRAIEGYRDAMVFTKLAPKRAGSGFEPKNVRKGAEGSLTRLGRDVIDLYQLHWTSNDVPVEETWAAMAELVDAGLVRYIGVSNFDRDLIERCEKVRHVDSLQPHFSMLWQEGKDDLFPFCASNGTGIICYGPLAFGLLTGAITTETKFGTDDWRAGGMGMGYYETLFAPGPLESSLEKVEALRPIADRLGITLAQLALAWVVHQPGVTGAIAGSRSSEHVKENAGAGSVELDDKDFEELESVLS